MHCLAFPSALFGAPFHSDNRTVADCVFWLEYASKTPLEVVADLPHRMRLFWLRCQIMRLRSVHIKPHYSQNAFDSALLAWYERGITQNHTVLSNFPKQQSFSYWAFHKGQIMFRKQFRIPTHFLNGFVIWTTCVHKHCKAMALTLCLTPNMVAQWVCLHGLESRSERRFKTWFGLFLIWKPDFSPCELFQIRLLKRVLKCGKKGRFGSWSA